MNCGKYCGFFTSDVKTMNDSQENLLSIYDFIYFQFYVPPFSHLSSSSKTIREIFRATGRTPKMKHGKPQERFYAKRAFRIIIAEAIKANLFPLILRSRSSFELATVDQVIEKFCISNRSCVKQLLNGEVSSDFVVSHALLCERYWVFTLVLFIQF
jgi:hypothetical protein